MSGSEHQQTTREGANADGFIAFPRNDDNHRQQQTQQQHHQYQDQRQQQWQRQFRGGGRSRGWGNNFNRGGRGGGGRGFRGRGRGRGGPGAGGRNFQQQEQRKHRFQGDDTIEELGDVPSSSSSDDRPRISIAVEGCCHGELDAIYERLLQHEATTGRKVDLLLCCGDFQSIRNLADLHTLACPVKYRELGSFYRYYSGEKVAPVLTLFIGGNHEASQSLQELPYGGWVAPNIYYMGYAGVVRFNGVRIGGISGIYKSHDYRKGRFEYPPFDKSTMRSIYHVRNVDVYRFKCLASSASTQSRVNMKDPPLDLMMSHDWPQAIEQHGDTAGLMRMKPFFREEIERNDLGSPANRELLEVLQPKWWFAAHLHVKFQATFVHDIQQTQKTESAETSPDAAIKSLVPSQTIKIPATNQQSQTTEQDQPASPPPSGSMMATTQFVAMESKDPCAGPDLTAQMTRFLSLDKCLPRRQYLSIVHILVSDRHADAKLQYDLEWLAVLKKTHDLTNTWNRLVEMPRHVMSITTEDVEWVRQRICGNSNDDHLPVIPENFCRTVPAHAGPASPLPRALPPPLPRMGNPQTDQLLALLELNHIDTIPYAASSFLPSSSFRPAAVDVNEINVEEDEEDAGDVIATATAITSVGGIDENEIDIENEEEEVEGDTDENEVDLGDGQGEQAVDDSSDGDNIHGKTQTVSSSKKPRVSASLSPPEAR